jgi:hypothetical protein
LDTGGNVFGGFTPLQWESDKRGKCKRDDSLRSFIFTLKNPHNTSARKFPLKLDQKQSAIFCGDSSEGPTFGDGDISVSNNCNSNTDSHTSFFNNVYTNDTGLDSETFFTGSRNFTVRDIEVFEITP